MLTCLLAGCAGRALHLPPTPDGTGSIVWNKDFHGYGGWEREARKRFGRESVVFVCHGAYDDRARLWMCYPDWLPRDAAGVKNGVPMQAVATLLRDVYGKDVPILLIVCNKGGKGGVSVAGAWYAKDIVWDRPTRALCGVGSIDGFIEGRMR